jgi:hypothetical protein
MTEMLFKNQAEEIVNETFANLLTEERRLEIEHIGKRWDFYDGNQIESVTNGQKYIKQYHGEKDQEWEDKEKIRWNYTRLVVDKYIERIFGKPVRVEFEEKKYQDIWDEITNPKTFDDISPFMKMVQRIAEISDTCAVIVRTDPKTGEISFEEIRGEFLHFIPMLENGKQIGQVQIAYPFDSFVPGDRIRHRVEIWDEEQFGVYIISDKSKKILYKDEGENPYGFIPMVLFQPKRDDNTFYGLTNIGDVVDINEAYNNLWTSLGVIVEMQSFSVLVIKSSTEFKAEFGPKRFIKFDNLPTDERSPDDAFYITPNAKISDVKNVLMMMKEELQNISSMPSTIIQTGSSTNLESGYALKIKQQPLESQYFDKKTTYGPSYLRLAKMAVIVSLVNSKNIYVPKFGDIIANVKFTEETETLSPNEQIAKDDFELQNNIITPIDIMMRENPEMTREEAETKWMENKKFNEMIGVEEFEDNEAMEEEPQEEAEENEAE